MARTVLTDGLVYTGKAFEQLDILMENGVVSALLQPGTQVEAGRSSAGGSIVAPGYIDTHTHGAVGVDANAAAVQDYARLAGFFAGQGVTGFLPSILTDSREQTLWAIGEAVAAAKGNSGGAALLGIHLEGPFLAPEYKGAMPEHLLQPASRELLAEYLEAGQGLVRSVTLSPEVPGVPGLIPWLVAQGVTAAIGHSGAGYALAMQCIEAGATVATHTGNAMRLIHQHEPGLLGAVLASDIYAEAICDGKHLHPGFVAMLAKAKGMGRVIAVTDSIMAAGLPDGKYKLGVNDVFVKEGDAKLASGMRAGSTLTMQTALQNLVAFTGRPIEECLPATSTNPAAAYGLADKGQIAEGFDADFVLLNPKDYSVQATIVGGELVYGL